METDFGHWFRCIADVKVCEVGGALRGRKGLVDTDGALGCSSCVRYHANFEDVGAVDHAGESEVAVAGLVVSDFVAINERRRDEREQPDHQVSLEKLPISFVRIHGRRMHSMLHRSPMLASSSYTHSLSLAPLPKQRGRPMWSPHWVCGRMYSSSIHFACSCEDDRRVRCPQEDEGSKREVKSVRTVAAANAGEMKKEIEQFS